MKKLHAYLYLGWHFLLHVLKKALFIYRPGGIERVEKNFAPDGITSLLKEERALLNQWQKCIGCGFCEAIAPELAVIPQHVHDAQLLGPQFLAESALRDITLTHLALPSAEAVAELNRQALQDICPVEIPLVELAEFLLRVDQATSRARKPRP